MVVIQGEVLGQGTSSGLLNGEGVLDDFRGQQSILTGGNHMGCLNRGEHDSFKTLEKELMVNDWGSKKRIMSEQRS